MQFEEELETPDSLVEYVTTLVSQRDYHVNNNSVIENLVQEGEFAIIESKHAL